MSVVQNILEGIIGNYIEVDEEQYVAMYSKRPLLDPYDKTVTRKQRIYLLKWNSNVDKDWRAVFARQKPVWYPFSNMPSIDIFAGPNKEFEEGITEWLTKLIFKKSKEMSR